MTGDYLRAPVKALIKPIFLTNLVKYVAAVICMAALATMMSSTAAVAASSLLDKLTADDGADTFLAPDVAFKLNLSVIDAENIRASFSIAPGHYLYRERLKFETEAANGKIAAVSLPASESKQDPTFGKQEVYHHDFNADIRLSELSSSQITLSATYQGCSEKGLCYAPIKKNFKLDLNAATPNLATAATDTSNTAASDDSDTARLLKTGNIWLIIAGFFVAGLFLSFTPCNYPMIPILSSIIVGSQSRQAKPSKLHAFGLSVAYVLGMALTYTAAGIAAALSGDLISQSLQNSWVLGATAILFVALALSMFGFYELKLPASFESKMLNATNKLKGGEFFGVFIMGAISALIVSPCISAPLSGALIVIGQTHNVFLGGVGLFALAIGMGVPLLLIGASAGGLLPKTGNWMNAVRNFFGVLMLGMAIWLISPVIAVSAQLALWAALLIVTAVYLNALDNLAAHADNLAKFFKGIAVIMLIVGVALLIGALSGAKSALQPLSGIGSSVVSSSARQQTAAALNFTRISSLAELEQKLAASNGQPVMLDFYADWCVACKELEQFTFNDLKVQNLLKSTTLLQVDVTANSVADKALLKRFALYGPPGIVFFNANGQEMHSLKTVGFQNAERFQATLTKRDRCIAPTPTNGAASIQC
jgi:thiol:disulfide interchange protein DsbD